MKKTFTIATLLCATTLGLAACGNSDSGDAATETSAETATDAVEAGGESSVIQLADGYCRAKPDADNPEEHENMTELDKKHSDMTACFGTFKNTSDKDVTVTGFSSPTLEEGATTELHEVVDGMMREKEGGFTIPASGEYKLEPGGDHLMIMNHPGAIAAGAKITIEISMSDGTNQVIEIPVREQPSGEENYAGNDGADDTEGAEDMHNMDEHAGHNH